MAIRYKPDGSFEFDTVQEAIDWHRAINGASHGGKLTNARVAQSPKQKLAEPTPSRALNGQQTEPTPPQPGEEEHLDEFFAALRANGSSIIKALADTHPSRIGTEELAKKAGVGATQLGPVFRHIYITGRRHGLAPEKIVRREEQHAEGEARSVYVLADELAAFIKEHEE